MVPHLKVQLIQMISNAQSGPYFYAERTAPPLGLLSMATFLQKSNTGVQIEILDNAVIPTRKIRDRISGDIVGFSINMWNYRESLKLAEVAKRKGAIVVFGGHHATSVPTQILNKRPFVDYVIMGDGELSFSRLIENAPIEVIPGLVFRGKSGIVQNPSIATNLDSLPIPSRKFVDLTPYFDNYKEAFPLSPFKRYTTIYSHKGCNWRNRKKNQGCIFCAIQDSGYRCRTSSSVWEELDYLKSSFGVEYVMDVGDSLTKSWLRRFADSKPESLKIAFTSYIRAADIDDEYCKLLSNLNCHSVFIGLESGDSTVLRASGKGAQVVDNTNAVSLLHSYGIESRLGVILGLPGESDASLNRTINLLEHLTSSAKIEGIYSSLMIPLPGSPSFSMLISQNGFAPRFMSTDIPDVDEMVDLWLSYFTKVSRKQLEDAQRHIWEIAQPICQ